jgi:hypothetical protein
VTDLRRVDGEWTPTDVLADCPDGETVSVYLESIGWEEFLAVGNEDSPMRIVTWRRSNEGNTVYLIEVADVLGGSPFVQVDTFPEVMDLLARWSPVVQSAAVTRFLEELREWEIDTDGIVEKIAARARFGVEDLYGPMRSDHDRRESERRATIRKLRADRERRKPQPAD